MESFHKLIEQNRLLKEQKNILLKALFEIELHTSDYADNNHLTYSPFDGWNGCKYYPNDIAKTALDTVKEQDEKWKLLP